LRRWWRAKAKDGRRWAAWRHALMFAFKKISLSIFLLFQIPNRKSPLYLCTFLVLNQALENTVWSEWILMGRGRYLIALAACTLRFGTIIHAIRSTYGTLSNDSTVISKHKVLSRIIALTWKSPTTSCLLLRSTSESVSRSLPFLFLLPSNFCD
jgi:hypothetical protein